MPTIKRLHPTLKACKCGFIGTRTQLYKHLDHEELQWKLSGDMETFYEQHGESVLNEDDPRLDTTKQLERSLDEQRQ